MAYLHVRLGIPQHRQDETKDVFTIGPCIRQPKPDRHESIDCYKILVIHNTFQMRSYQQSVVLKRATAFGQDCEDLVQSHNGMTSRSEVMKLSFTVSVQLFYISFDKPHMAGRTQLLINLFNEMQYGIFPMKSQLQRSHTTHPNQCRFCAKL